MKKILFLILSAFVVSGCATQQAEPIVPKVVPNVEASAEIKHLVLQNGVTTKADVLNVLGQPETAHSFEKEDLWHYRGERTPNLIISVIDKQNLKLVYKSVAYFNVTFDVKTGLLLSSSVSNR